MVLEVTDQTFEKEVMKELGLRASRVSTQVVPRENFARIVSDIAILSGSIEQVAKEIRNLQRTEIGEVSEGFGKKQVGSSAMAYKRNPMRCERACALSRFLLVAPLHGAFTTAVQWFERTLDDSAIRRLSLPEVPYRFRFAGCSRMPF